MGKTMPTLNVTKILSLLVPAVLALITLNGCKEEKPKAEQGQKAPATLMVNMSIDYPPFEFYKNNEIVGFEVDLMRAVAKKMGKEATFKDASFDSLIAALIVKRADVVISALSATDERRKSVDFSTAYHVSQSVLVTANPDLKTVEAFKGRKVGVQAGSAYEPYVKEWQTKGGPSYQALSKVPELVQSLKTQRIDGIIMGLHEANALVKQMPDMKLAIVEIPDTTIEYAIALPKGSPLLAEINAALAALEKDGTLKALVDQWFHDAPVGAGEKSTS
jgi:polar amino acid transport system substrate-binding protein